MPTAMIAARIALARWAPIFPAAAGVRALAEYWIVTSARSAFTVTVAVPCERTSGIS